MAHPETVLHGLLALLASCALAASAAAEQTTSYRTTSVSGCILEQPGPKYVLRDVKQVKVVAELESVVFPVETFAKHLGRQVRLQGRLSTGGGPAVMRVRTIKALSAPCASK